MIIRDIWFCRINDREGPRLTRYSCSLGTNTISFFVQSLAEQQLLGSAWASKEKIWLKRPVYKSDDMHRKYLDKN